MLAEQPCRQVPDDYSRRWLFDDYFDLIVWSEPDGRFHGFQLCYDKSGQECALTWTSDQGFLHQIVQSGDQNPTANLTPVLVAGGTFPADLVRREFLRRSREIDPAVRELVLARLTEYDSGR